MPIVKFVRNTHYMFSIGKDRLVKYWDADKFELLLTLEGHHFEVWCLEISNHGDYLVSGSHDRSIRYWDHTEEPFFVERKRKGWKRCLNLTLITHLKISMCQRKNFLRKEL